jgi:putative AlgH/UPF0301 family transcriptional regulator
MTHPHSPRHHMSRCSHQGMLLVSLTHSDAHYELNRSVVLITQHHPGGEAVGVRINCPLRSFGILELAEGMGMPSHALNQAQPNLQHVPIYHGGARCADQAQIIHTRDWSSASTLMLTEDLAVTSDTSILAALVMGQGPQQFRVCMGMCVWSNLHEDLAQPHQHHWQPVPAREDLVFDLDSQQQWRHCLDQAVQHSVRQWSHTVLLAER